MSNRTVLVTGANGYIGGAVAEAFRRSGWNVLGLTRHRDGAAHLERQEITPVLADVTSPHATAGLVGASLDVVVSTTETSVRSAEHFAYVRAFLDSVSASSSAHGTRPLVLFTSGSKDYGDMQERHGDPDLRAHTEDSPLNPHPLAADRARFADSLLSSTDRGYAVAVLRPVVIYGRSGGLYGFLFDHARASTGTLTLRADPRTILHSVHVDDCARAYVSVAELGMKQTLDGAVFNIANRSFETAKQVGTALAASYGLRLDFQSADPNDLTLDAHLVANTSQLVSSARIRELTDWKERMPLFSDGLDQFRTAYEATRRSAAG